MDQIMYSVMKDGNSFRGDVVSNGFNKTSWDEENILEQIQESKYLRYILIIILILYTFHANAY